MKGKTMSDEQGKAIVEQERDEIISLISKEVPSALLESIQFAIQCFEEPDQQPDITVSYEGACYANQE